MKKEIVICDECEGGIDSCCVPICLRHQGIEVFFNALHEPQVKKDLIEYDVDFCSIECARRFMTEAIDECFGKRTSPA